MDLVFILLTGIFGTIIINRLLLAFSKNLGTRGAENIQVRWASTTKPSLGGFSYFLVFVSLVGVTGLLDLEYFIFTKKQLLGVFISVSCGFGVGFADDTYNTNPKLKAIGQSICALILFFFDIQIQLFDTQFLNFVFTSFWVIGLMNSINMLDNMDGVTASTSIWIILFYVLAIFSYTNIDKNILFILVGVLGSLIGFLYHNWFPAKLYMGDAGSQFLGVFLSVFSIPLLWNNPSFTFEIPLLSKFIIPYLVFCIPLIDTITVIYFRLKRGSSPFIGGSDHTTHHLVYFGFSERQVVFFFSSINLIGLIITYLFQKIYLDAFIYSFSIIIYLIILNLLIVFLYIRGSVNSELRKKKPVKSRSSIYDKLVK